MHLSPYIRLMRLDKPVGIWLLLWPCWWSTTLASNGRPSVYILLLFALGSILMRSAGCIINDIADREFDKQVERTRTRPLASGELSLKQALVCLACLLIYAALVVFQLGSLVFMWGLISLVPVILYPFMKRISWWPQLFLGFTFNWGAMMGWVAVRGELNLAPMLLYTAGIFWTLGYDTIYAHQDKVDDARIGVKSTALRLGAGTKKAVSTFYLLATLFIALSGWIAGCSIGLYAILALVQLHFSWQVCTVNLDDPTSCRRIFVSNIALGGLLFAGFIVGHA